MTKQPGKAGVKARLLPTNLYTPRGKNGPPHGTSEFGIH